VIVPPDSIIAIDGVVMDGESGVDQAPITGESVPVDKFPSTDFEPGITDPTTLAAEQKVFAGTINGPGALKVYVTRKSADSTLSKLMRMVTEAESQRSPTQRLTDKFERYFVPAVLIFVLLLLMVWLVVDEPFSQSFYRAMAVLVGASPCALAIATPSAVLSGVARGGHRGVLFKGGGPLELLGRVDQIAFDKTGTLTAGKPHLTDVVLMAGVDEVKLLQVAAAVERLSAHPIARAIWLAAKERLGDRPIPLATEFRSITGRGVTAMLDNEIVAIGSEALFQKTFAPESRDSLSAGLPSSLKSEIDRLRTAGRTIMIVKQGDHFLGVLGMLDTARVTAKPTIARLRSMGIRRMLMLSGDHQVVADAIAAGVGLDDARGDLMPEDKVSAMKDLTSQSLTAMVGDGVNDAPAMATASVAIAMGAAGSDVAMETADVALMGDDLSRLPFAIGLSRQTARIIRQNLWISLGMVAILIPAGLLGLNLAAAVVFHEGSTVVVVLNALRLLAYKNPES
jgi:Cd2+/Zn2+-exporting ATPase